MVIRDYVDAERPRRGPEQRRLMVNQDLLDRIIVTATTGRAVDVLIEPGWKHKVRCNIATRLRKNGYRLHSRTIANDRLRCWVEPVVPGPNQRIVCW